MGSSRQRAQFNFEEQAKRDANQVEQRRLREQLRQEQLKVEALRQNTTARLDRHDQALGIDTKEEGTPTSLPPPRPADQSPRLTVSPPPVTPRAPEGFPEQEWYFAEEGSQLGPFPWQEIYQEARSGRIKAETMVWVSGLPEWKPAREIPSLIPS